MHIFERKEGINDVWSQRLLRLNLLMETIWSLLKNTFHSKIQPGDSVTSLSEFCSER